MNRRTLFQVIAGFFASLLAPLSTASAAPRKAALHHPSITRAEFWNLFDQGCNEPGSFRIRYTLKPGQYTFNELAKIETHMAGFYADPAKFRWVCSTYLVANKGEWITTITQTFAPRNLSENIA